MPSTIRLDIISIGALSRNRLWNETQPLRTAHATTSLIRVGKHNILVDPGLPAAAIAARLNERTGLKPSQIDLVFLTNFRPSHRAGLSAFSSAKVLIHEIEQQAASEQLQQLLSNGSPEELEVLQPREQLDLLERFQPAPDTLADGVDLFPLFGYTPGNCGLIVAAPTLTILIAGDAVATQDHFLAGQVLPDSQNIKAAQESLQEVYEIADLIVPGHDNVFLNPRMHGI